MNPITRRLLYTSKYYHFRIKKLYFTFSKQQQKRSFFQYNRKEQIGVDQPLTEDDLKPLPSILFLLPAGLFIVIYILLNLGFTSK